MIDVVASSIRAIELGRLGENEHRRVLFDIGEFREMYPDAEFSLVYQPADTEAYPVSTITVEDTCLYWLVTSADLAKEGRGKCELIVKDGDVIAKSVIYSTRVLRALDGSGDPPEPWQSWLEVFTGLKDDAETAAHTAVQSAEAVMSMGAEAETLTPGSDATVSKDVDPETGAVTLTFGIPQGQPGVSPAATVEKTGNAATITLTDQSGTTTAQVMDGEKGDPGDPGQPGQDGYSPTASVTKSGDTATITITDKNGTTTATVSDGAKGDPGQPGDKGDPGEGVPTGGTAGQVLVKGSVADYDTVWQDPAGGGADWDAESGKDGYVANRPIYLGATDIDYITDESIACATQSLEGVWWWSGYTGGTYIGEIPLDVMRDPDVTWVVTIDGVRYTTKGQRDGQTVLLGAESPGDPAALTVGYSVQLAEINGQYGAVALLAVASDAAKTVDFSLGIVGSGTVVDPRYDLRADWDEADSSSFRYIRNKPSLIGDVQVNGSSVVQNGIANIPIGSTAQYGVYKVSNAYGTDVYNGCLQVMRASDASIKSGSGSMRPIVPDVQHASAFYGLAKAAGDSTQSASSNAVGVYTESAKSAISQMLGGAISISGTVISLAAKAGVRYICIGDVSQLTFTPSATGICDVRFTSGSTATVLTVPSTVLWPDWFDPTALEANTRYEINIMDGIYGAVAAWS